MASTQNGRFPITDGITRNRGRAVPGTSVSRHRRFQTRFSARNSCRFWTPIVTSNARLNTAYSFWCSSSRRSFCSRLRRAKKFIRFSWAYLIAAVASMLLITWYCRFFLGGGVRTFMIGAGLAGVYLFLYITLRQQDYALLMGAIALFVVLAIVMYVTRKVDWYARTPPKAPRRLAQKITQRYF